MSGNTPRPKLCVAGKILHIVRKKSLDKKSSTTSYEMRWAAPEDFVELKGIKIIFAKFSKVFNNFSFQLCLECFSIISHKIY